jgi:putative redox protein
MNISINWKGNMAFVGNSPGGFPIELDAESNVGGMNRGMLPMEMIAFGLAGCTAMDVISILKKKRQDVKEFEVKVDAPRASDHPKVFTNAIITYSVLGKNIDKTAVLRAIELSSTKYCPAQTMLSQAFPIDLRYEIYEDNEDGTQALIHQGVWQEMVPE